MNGELYVCGYQISHLILDRSDKTVIFRDVSVLDHTSLIRKLYFISILLVQRRPESWGKGFFILFGHQISDGIIKTNYFNCFQLLDVFVIRILMFPSG